MRPSKHPPQRLGDRVSQREHDHRMVSSPQRLNKSSMSRQMSCHCGLPRSIRMPDSTRMDSMPGTAASLSILAAMVIDVRLS
jgi:hypothetical protein